MSKKYWISLTEIKNKKIQVEMKRRRTPVLLQVYLPSGLFVIVSWISFIVPPEVVPGKKKPSNLSSFLEMEEKAAGKSVFKIFILFIQLYFALLTVATIRISIVVYLIEDFCYSWNLISKCFFFLQINLHNWPNNTILWDNIFLKWNYTILPIHFISIWITLIRQRVEINAP